MIILSVSKNFTSLAQMEQLLVPWMESYRKFLRGCYFAVLHSI